VELAKRVLLDEDVKLSNFTKYAISKMKAQPAFHIVAVKLVTNLQQRRIIEE
jgi:hypothetical protein